MRHAVEHNSPESLWATLENFLNAAIAMFGDAAALLERALIGRGEHRAACAWLACCEHLLRRLIFIDAAQLLKQLWTSNSLRARHQTGANLKSVALETSKPKASLDLKCDKEADPGPGSHLRSDAFASLAPAAKPRPHPPRAGAPSTRPGASFALILAPRRGARGGVVGGVLYNKEPEQTGEFIDPDAMRERAAEMARLRNELFPRPSPAPNRQQTRRELRERMASPAYLSTRGLAHRFEALVAAARARKRVARRLARRLDRDRVLARCFTLPPRASFRPRPIPGDYTVADAAEFAHRAWAAACDTS